MSKGLIIFDFDGTLGDTRRNIVTTMQMKMGANAGTKACGVTWGNGTKEELENAGATFVIDRMEDLIEIVNVDKISIR